MYTVNVLAPELNILVGQDLQSQPTNYKVLIHDKEPSSSTCFFYRHKIINLHLKKIIFILLTFLVKTRNIVMERGHYHGTFIYLFRGYYGVSYFIDRVSGAQSGYEKHRHYFLSVESDGEKECTAAKFCRPENRAAQKSAQTKGGKSCAEKRTGKIVEAMLLLWHKNGKACKRFKLAGFCILMLNVNYFVTYITSFTALITFSGFGRYSWISVGA